MLIVIDNMTPVRAVDHAGLGLAVKNAGASYQLVIYDLAGLTSDGFRAEVLIYSGTEIDALKMFQKIVAAVGAAELVWSVSAHLPP